MAVEPHLRLTAAGEFQSGSSSPWEIWSWRLNLHGSANVALYKTQEIAEDFATDIQAFHVSAGARISSACVLREVKLAHIGADGRYVSDPIIIDRNARGSVSGMPNAPQIALAVSLDTERRGASGRGRFYMPGFSGSANPTTGRIEPFVADQAASAAQTMLNAVNNLPSVDGLASPRVVIVSSKGFVSPVTSVRVGQVLDTIRSRRNAIGEAYGASLPVQ